MDREKVIKGLNDIGGFVAERIGIEQARNFIRTIDDACALLKEQKEVKEQFIEAFNTIRDAYNAPANREKILLNYLARNACCCEQKEAK